MYNNSQQQQQQQQQNPMNLLISPFNPSPDYNDDSVQLQYASDPSPSQQQEIYNNQSPQFEMMNYSNEFISHSPESSSSAESNLISPPQQYYPSDMNWTDNNNNTHSSFMGSDYTNHRHATSSSTMKKRSSSVPPHYNKFRPAQQQDYMYNQFQVVNHLQQPNSTTTTATKPLPIKIPRMHPGHLHLNQPMDMEAYRRQLDEKLEKINFDDITVAELKDALRERGLPATGRKAELLSRLKRERDLLKDRNAIAEAAAAVDSLTSPSMMATTTTTTTTPLHRRVTHLNLSSSEDSPTKRHQRLYNPYSPPPYSNPRLAFSVPETNTQLFLNDQYMNRPSSLSNPIELEEQQRKDIWDDQTLQNFLNQI
ncbi:hypothetical protein BD770DRAFT_445283 [Pilaira anomala]|nr:hypothetical protein BD770DRAFT_445283 [Pilaira anomala]